MYMIRRRRSHIIISYSWLAKSPISLMTILKKMKQMVRNDEFAYVSEVFRIVGHSTVNLRIINLRIITRNLIEISLNVLRRRNATKTFHINTWMFALYVLFTWYPKGTKHSKFLIPFAHSWPISDSRIFTHKPGNTHRCIHRAWPIVLPTNRMVQS